MIFYFFASILIISAILVVTLKNLFHCALFLIVALFAMAGLYFIYDAPFLGAAQIIVYVGAIMVLVIFAIMLTARISNRFLQAANHLIIPAMLATGALVMLIILALQRARIIYFGTLRFDPIIDLGKALLTTYLLPFEVISLVLLLALVGAISRARKN